MLYSKRASLILTVQYVNSNVPTLMKELAVHTRYTDPSLFGEQNFHYGKGAPWH